MSRHRTNRPIAEELRELMARERDAGTGRPTTVRQLAVLLGVNQAHLSRMLNGKRPLPTDTVAAIAETYSLSADYFVEYRRARVIAESAANPALLDCVYDAITRNPLSPIDTTRPRRRK